MARPSAVSTNAASPCPTSRNVTRNVPAAGRSRGDQTQSSNSPPAKAPASRPAPNRHQIKATPSSRKKPAICQDRKSTRLNSSHLGISYAVFCLKKKKGQHDEHGRE